MDQLHMEVQNTRPRLRGIGWFEPAAAARLAPVFIAALLASFLFYQSRFDQTFRYYPFTWNARWIGSPYHAGHAACFRKEVFVSGQVRSAYLAVVGSNFADIFVNGKQLTPFFDTQADEYDQRLDPVTGQATHYTALGYPRNDTLGHLYAFSTALHGGENVIAVFSQTDEGEPRVAVRGEIVADMRQEIASDATWRCSPFEQSQNRVPWTSPGYFDGAWMHAVESDAVRSTPVDGDVAILGAPAIGEYITALVPRMEVGALFRRVEVFPDTVQEGWLRIASAAPYDLSVNGRVVGSTAMIGRYERSLLVQGDNAITLEKARHAGTEAEYPVDETAARAGVYLLKNVFHRGANEISIRLATKDITDKGSLPSVYLDGQVTFRSGGTSRIATDGTWDAKPIAAGAAWTPAQVLSRPDLIVPGFEHANLTDKIDPGSASDFRVIRNAALFTLAFLLAGWLPAMAVGERRKGSGVPITMQIGAVYIMPSVIMGAAVALETIFRPSPQDAIFSSMTFARWVLLAAALSWAAGLAVAVFSTRRPSHGRPSRRATSARRTEIGARTRAFLARYGFALCLAAVMIAAAMYSTAALDKNGFIPDEYVSIIAARGILRTGLPRYQGSGILYPRSSLYHYMLAPLVALGLHYGNLAVTRLLAAFWHVLLVPVVYLFGREIRSKKVGLAAAALTAFSPFALYYAREARFYTQFAFFCTLTFYLLLRSVRNPGNDRYRVGVIGAFLAGYLSQELLMSMIPAIALVIFLSGQTRRWLRPPILALIGAALCVMAFDLYAYFRWCQTPLAWIDPDAYPLLAFHVDDLFNMASILLTSNERSQMAVGTVYLLGAAWLVARLFRSRPNDRPAADAFTWYWWNYLYLITGVSLFVLTVTTPHPNSRYTLALLPPVALAAACVASELGRRIGRWLTATSTQRAGAIAGVLYFAAITTVCAAAYRPVRTWDANERTYISDFTAASRYIKAHMRPGDKIMAFQPEVALAELDQCDYFWRPYNQTQDKYMGNDGRLRERNSGSVVIDNADKLRAVMTRYPRVWLVYPPKNLSAARALPVAEMNSMLTDNFQLCYHQLNAEVWLWDRSRNHYRDYVHNSGLDQVNF